MIEKLIDNISKVIVGKEDQITKIVAAFISGGHVLIEDIPGVGKTSLSKALARSIDVDYSRVQFTPDLMPSDILGITIYSKEREGFLFNKGPIFSNIVLADEINRASPKSQSSLLEAMEERQITMDGKIYGLESPFLVIGTQNPVDYEGTFPLPEAQLDRFMIRISLGYPEFSQELRLLTDDDGVYQIEDISSVMGKDDFADVIDKVKKVNVSESVSRYILDIVTGTRSHHDAVLGCSPRASKNLQSMAKGIAYIRGRDYVIPEDVQQVATEVLSHRVILRAEARYRGVSQSDFIQEIVKNTKIPKVT